MTRLQRLYLWLFSFYNKLPDYLQIFTLGAIGSLCYLIKQNLDGGNFRIQDYIAILTAYVGNIVAYYGKLALEKKLQIEKLQSIANQEKMGR